MIREFIFTNNNDGLSEDQKKCYEDLGFILIKNMVPDESIDKIYNRFIEVSEGNTANVRNVLKISHLSKRPDVKGEYTINKIQDFMHDPIFFEHFIAHYNVVKILNSIIGPNITAVNSMIINKPPNAEYKLSRHPIHQDMHYFPFRPANKIIGTWMAMEEVTEENGCLFVVPGSHKTDKLFKHVYPKAVDKQMYHCIKGFDHLPRVNICMQKGDCLFFHPLLFHGSGPNLTKGFRKAISVHYADSNCNFIDTKGSEHENLEKETFIVAKRTGIPMNNLKHFFQMRARLVSGRPGNFQNQDSNL